WTRKSVAAWMRGSGRNHTSRPALSTIIGPFCFWSFFCLALRKTKPGAVGWRFGETVTSGGGRAGRRRAGGGGPPVRLSRTRLGDGHDAQAEVARVGVAEVQPGAHRHGLAGGEALARDPARALPVGVRADAPRVRAASRAAHADRAQARGRDAAERQLRRRRR